MHLNERKTVYVEAGSQTEIGFHAEALRRMIMALNRQRIVWKWRRRVDAKRMAAEYGEDVPLGIGYPRGWCFRVTTTAPY
jgi:hypothetical protein